jgi:hypothetical protein
MTSHLVSETLNVLQPTLVPDALGLQSPLKLRGLRAYSFQYMDSLQLKYRSMRSSVGVNKIISFVNILPIHYSYVMQFTTLLIHQISHTALA